MQIISGITDAPCQIFSLAIPDGSTANITIAYRPEQQGWFFDLYWNAKSPQFQILGRRITTFPNLLRQFETQLSFGLACVTSDGYEPLNLNDFQSGYATFYLLDQTDMATIESSVFVGS